MNKVLAMVMAAAVAALPACSRASGEPAGPAVQRSFAVGGFERIAVSGPYRVEVRTGGAPGARAEGPQEALERLVVEVRGDELRIHPRKESWMGFGSGASRHGEVRLTVTVPRLSAARIAGSGDMSIDRVEGERFEGAVAGSGNLDLGAIEVGELKLAVAGSGDVRAGRGRARTIEFKIAGSGDVDAAAVASETASVSIAGSGNLRAQASRAAEVKIAGSGDVELSGGARCSVSKAGSGNVRCS